jgi:hypothetical protein
VRDLERLAQAAQRGHVVGAVLHRLVQALQAGPKRSVSLIDEALEEIIVTDKDRKLVRVPLPPEPTAVVEPVISLAAAKAQVARLSARLMQLCGGVVAFE